MNSYDDEVKVQEPVQEPAMEEKPKMDEQINKEHPQQVKKTVKKVKKDDGVNRWIYILLAFFFGMFGLHRFYAKHWIAGIFYILFCGIGTVLTIIGVGVFILWIEGLVCVYDIIRALMADRDEEGQIHV